MSLACLGQGVISTIAGTGADSSTGDNGPATSASLHPDGVTLDSLGNIYVADLANSVIRKINTAGIITTVAGFAGERTAFSGDGGPATSASIYISNFHNGLAVDGAGNLYIADDGHHRIRKVDVNGIITTVAGNGQQNYSGDNVAATSTSLYRPTGVAVDRAGNLYIADTLNARVRKVDTNGIITTIAGTGALANTGDGGPAASAALFSPTGVALDNAGNVYIVDRESYVVRKINAAGIITTVAGNGTLGTSGDGGPAINAQLGNPTAVAIDLAGNLYISDGPHLRMVNTAGIITTVAGGGGTPGAGNIGDGGTPTSASLNAADVALDAAGNYYIADIGNNRIRKVNVSAHPPGILVSTGSLYFSTNAGGLTPNSQITTIFTTAPTPIKFSTSATAATGGSWLQATASAGITPVEMTVSITTLPPAGTYKGTITITPAASDLAVVTIPVTLVITPAQGTRPAVTSVVNGASFQTPVAPNSWATIQGTNLASTTDNWNSSITNGQLPASLDGVVVLFDGKPAYLSYISPTQINLVVPNIRSTTTSVLVINNGAKPTNLFNTPASTNGPSFFLWPNNQVVATRQDYSYAVKSGTFPTLATVAAKPGDVLILWGNGFGTTTPAVPLGYVTPSDQTYSAATAPTVTIGGVSATVYGVAQASGFAGLYQVAIQVPPSLGNGDWPIVATVSGTSSPATTVLSVQK